jgi:hypothetical protein
MERISDIVIPGNQALNLCEKKDEFFKMRTISKVVTNVVAENRQSKTRMKAS